MDKQALDHAVRFIRPWLALRYDREEIPGFVAAIAHDGEVVMNEAYGYADLERKVPLSPGHVFRIASHSKTFTATAVMQLAEAGRLRLDDRAAEYLPWLSGHTDARWSRVTVRQLLAHIGGVIRDGTNADYWQLERPFPDADRLRQEVLAQGLVVDENVKMKYSNYGYSLLGLVVEAVAGLPYNDFVTERIVKPLGLAHTYPEYAPALEPLLATGYTRKELGRRLPIGHIDTHAMSPATGFMSTAEDLCAYFTAHMVGSGRLLSDESKREMQRVHWHAKVLGESGHEDYGLGMILEEIGKRHVFGHSGGFPGFITQSKADPKDRLVVVALTNAIDGPAASIVQGIYKTLSWFQENASDAPAAHDLRHLEGQYTALWGTTSIVTSGDKIVAAHPDGWSPFDAVESLAYVDDTTLRVTDTSSFASEDELVRFSLRDGHVESVDYTGTTMWPREAWLARTRDRLRVGG